MPKITVSLEEALKFYGLAEADLYVREVDAEGKPVKYAVRITPEYVVIVLRSGPKLRFPPSTREHIAFVPKKNRKVAMALAGLGAEEEAEDEEDENIVDAPKRGGRAQRGQP